MPNQKWPRQGYIIIISICSYVPVLTCLRSRNGTEITKNQETGRNNIKDQVEPKRRSRNRTEITNDQVETEQKTPKIENQSGIHQRSRNGTE
jgi:hypothetical protein